MSYIDRHLLFDEQIVYRTHLHWVIFLLPVSFTIFAFLFAQYAAFDLEIIDYGAYIIAACFWISAYARYLSCEFVVTNQRIMMKLGLVQVNLAETLLQRVEGIQVQQSIFGRLLGYGTVIITGVGGGKEIFHQITSPMELRRMIQERLSSSKISEVGVSA